MTPIGDWKEAWEGAKERAEVSCRFHDLRHTFAVRTMLNWYRSGEDVGREMIKLTTWLGHASPAHTYWYLEAVPELLELASARMTGVSAEEETLMGWLQETWEIQ